MKITPRIQIYTTAIVALLVNMPNVASAQMTIRVDAGALLGKQFNVAPGEMVVGAEIRGLTRSKAALHVSLSREQGPDVVTVRTTTSTDGVVRVDWPEPVNAQSGGKYFVSFHMPTETISEVKDVDTPTGSFVGISRTELTALGVDLPIKLLTERSAQSPVSWISAKPLRHSGVRVSFSTPREGLVHIRIYDVAGRLVRDAFNQHVIAGTHNITWDARNSRGVEVGTGVYLIQFDNGSEQLSTKHVIVR